MVHGVSSAARSSVSSDVAVDRANSIDADPVFEEVSRYFSLLAEPMRIRILHVICNEEKSVSQIVAQTGATQTNVSRHLNTLYEAGVLSRRRQGNFIFYAVSDSTLTDLCRLVCINVAAKSEARELAGETARVVVSRFDLIGSPD